MFWVLGDPREHAFHHKMKKRHQHLSGNCLSSLVPSLLDHNANSFGDCADVVHIVVIYRSRTGLVFCQMRRGYLSVQPWNCCACEACHSYEAELLAHIFLLAGTVWQAMNPVIASSENGVGLCLVVADVNTCCVICYRSSNRSVDTLCLYDSNCCPLRLCRPETGGYTKHAFLSMCFNMLVVIPQHIHTQTWANEKFNGWYVLWYP